MASVTVSGIGNTHQTFRVVVISLLDEMINPGLFLNIEETFRNVYKESLSELIQNLNDGKDVHVKIEYKAFTWDMEKYQLSVTALSGDAFIILTKDSLLEMGTKMMKLVIEANEQQGKSNTPVLIRSLNMSSLLGVSEFNSQHPTSKQINSNTSDSPLSDNESLSGRRHKESHGYGDSVSFVNSHFPNVSSILDHASQNDNSLGEENLMRYQTLQDSPSGNCENESCNADGLMTFKRYRLPIVSTERTTNMNPKASSPNKIKEGDINKNHSQEDHKVSWTSTNNNLSPKGCEISDDSYVSFYANRFCGMCQTTSTMNKRLSLLNEETGRIFKKIQPRSDTDHSIQQKTDVQRKGILCRTREWFRSSAESVRKSKYNRGYTNGGCSPDYTDVLQRGTIDPKECTESSPNIKENQSGTDSASVSERTQRGTAWSPTWATIRKYHCSTIKKEVRAKENMLNVPRAPQDGSNKRDSMVANCQTSHGGLFPKDIFLDLCQELEQMPSYKNSSIRQHTE